MESPLLYNAKKFLESIFNISSKNAMAWSYLPNSKTAFALSINESILFSPLGSLCFFFQKFTNTWKHQITHKSILILNLYDGQSDSVRSNACSTLFAYKNVV